MAKVSHWELSGGECHAAPPAERREWDREVRRREQLRRAKSMRLKRIECFEQQQLRTRDWISFAEIIDWRSRLGEPDGSINKAKEVAAIQDLDRLLGGGAAFNAADCESRILITHPDIPLSKLLLSKPSDLPPTAWMTRERWLTLKATSDQATREFTVRCCWMTNHLCLTWCRNVPFAPKPHWASDQIPGLLVPALEQQRKNKYRLKDTRPRQRAAGAAWDFIRQHPQVLENSQSIDAIATKIEEFRANMPPAARIGGGFSTTAITKALVNSQPQKQRTNKAPVTNSAE